MITKKCRDCGKEFTLTDGEINFYRSKGFDLPNRCKACRDKRKGVKTYSPDTQRHTSPTKKTKLPEYILILILAAGLIFTAVTKLTDAFITSSELPRPTAAVTESTVPSLTISETYADTSAASRETDISTSAKESAEYIETTAETTSETAAPTTVTTAESVTSASSVTTSPTVPALRFRNEEYLNEHYEKHGKEMGFSTPEAYEAAAAAVVSSPDALHKLEKEDGDDVYYLESTNEFVIVSTDGYIRTYFYPESGKKYFDKQ